MWMKLLQDAVAVSTKKAVADNLGVSRSTVSLIMNGKYPASSGHVAQKVLNVYGRIHCPHLDAEITPERCRSCRTGSAPISNPRAMKHWRACQVCVHNPESEKKSAKNPVNGEPHVSYSTNKE